jgi:L-threonylcarbamoyladenylate synthase
MPQWQARGRHIFSRTMKQQRGESIATAVAALKRGEVIVFPTETLYGLGAQALNHSAVDAVFRLKGRDPNTPIPVLVSDQAMLDQLIATIPPIAKQLMQRFWPGPLTLVLPARAHIPKPLLNPSNGIGIRISSQPIAMELVQALGAPLTATSANPSGAEPARTVPEARNYFGDSVNVFVDGGPLGSKTGSTVAEIRGDKLRIIREGEIPTPDLEAVLGRGSILP